MLGLHTVWAGQSYRTEKYQSWEVIQDFFSSVVLSDRTVQLLADCNFAVLKRLILVGAGIWIGFPATCCDAGILR